MAESNLAQFVQKARYIGSKKYPTTLVTKVLVYEENLAFSQASHYLICFKFTATTLYTDFSVSH